MVTDKGYTAYRIKSEPDPKPEPVTLNFFSLQFYLKVGIFVPV